MNTTPIMGMVAALCAAPVIAVLSVISLFEMYRKVAGS